MDKPLNTYDQDHVTSPDRGIQLDEDWGIALQVVLCENCDWRYLTAAGELPEYCPHCFRAALVLLDDGVQEMPYTRPPELVLPFTLSSQGVTQAVRRFASDIPFAPIDLTPESLDERLRRVYLPMWLVDASVKATWQAEAGFDYEVVSHQDFYNQSRGGWSSQQIKETRIRWEPRLGTLRREYRNIVASALDQDAELKAAVGEYQLSSAQAYRSLALSSAVVRLPDRKPQDAWDTAQLGFQAEAAEECRQAACADHIRQFTWRPAYEDQNWTMLLLPLYTAFYLDDEHKPQIVLLHGQTGRTHGTRRASLKRAQRTSLIILGVAVLLFLISGLLALAAALMPVLLAVGVLGLAISLVVGLGALGPIITVWWFNRKENPGDAE